MNKYLYPSHLRSLFSNDEFSLLCRYHWNRLKHLLKKDDESKFSSLALWGQRGEDFETEQGTNLVTKFGSKNVCRLNRISGFETNKAKTLTAMQNKIPFIIEAHLEDNHGKMRAITDLLVRSDWIDKLSFIHLPPIVACEKNKKSKFSDSFHYVPMDFKLGSLLIYTERGKKISEYENFELSSQKKHNHNQILFTMDILSHIQGYTPQFGFNISGSGIKVGKNTYSTWTIPSVIYQKPKHRNLKLLHNSYSKNINRAWEIMNLDVKENITMNELRKLCTDCNILVNNYYDRDSYSDARNLVFPRKQDEEPVKQFFQKIKNNVEIYESELVQPAKRKKRVIDDEEVFPIVLSIDNEFIPDMRITDIHAEKRPMVYMIGISQYDGETKQRQSYMAFFSDSLEKQSEKKMVEEFAKYLNRITSNGTKPFVMLHYHNPEVMDIKRWTKEYNFLDMCPYFDTKKHMKDVLQYVKILDVEKVLSKNNYGYGLKAVTRFCVKHKDELGIPNIRDWNENITGEDTIDMIIKFFKTNELELLNRIIYYNRNDCDACAEIALFMQKN